MVCLHIIGSGLKRDSSCAVDIVPSMICNIQLYANWYKYSSSPPRPTSPVPSPPLVTFNDHPYACVTVSRRTQSSNPYAISGYQMKRIVSFERDDEKPVCRRNSFSQYVHMGICDIHGTYTCPQPVIYENVNSVPNSPISVRLRTPTGGPKLPNVIGTSNPIYQTVNDQLSEMEELVAAMSTYLASESDVTTENIDDNVGTSQAVNVFTGPEQNQCSGNVRGHDHYESTPIYQVPTNNGPIKCKQPVGGIADDQMDSPPSHYNTYRSEYNNTGVTVANDDVGLYNLCATERRQVAIRSSGRVLRHSNTVGRVGITECDEDNVDDRREQLPPIQLWSSSPLCRGRESPVLTKPPVPEHRVRAAVSNMPVTGRSSRSNDRMPPADLYAEHARELQSRLSVILSNNGDNATKSFSSTVRKPYTSYSVSDDRATSAVTDTISTDTVTTTRVTTGDVITTNTVRLFGDKVCCTSTVTTPQNTCSRNATNYKRHNGPGNTVNGCRINSITTSAVGDNTVYPTNDVTSSAVKIDQAGTNTCTQYSVNINNGNTEMIHDKAEKKAQYGSNINVTVGGQAADKDTTVRPVCNDEKVQSTLCARTSSARSNPSPHRQRLYTSQCLASRDNVYIGKARNRYKRSSTLPTILDETDELAIMESVRDQLTTLTGQLDSINRKATFQRQLDSLNEQIDFLIRHRTEQESTPITSSRSADSTIRRQRKNTSGGGKKQRDRTFMTTTYTSLNPLDLGQTTEDEAFTSIQNLARRSNTAGSGCYAVHNGNRKRDPRTRNEATLSDDDVSDNGHTKQSWVRSFLFCM